MSDLYIWGAILGLGVTNYVLRATPFLALAGVELPPWAQRWLDFIPVSVMAALVVGEVVRPSGAWLTPWHNPYLWASIGTGLIYWRWRSLIGATVAGIALFVAFRWLLGMVPF